MRSVRIAFALSFALMLGLIVYGQSDLKPSGEVVNGQSISVRESRESVDEAKRLGAAIQGDPGADVSKLEAQTRLGRLVRDLASEMQGVQRWHDDALKDLSIDEVMAAKTMRSRASIAEALSKLEDLERLEAEYQDRMLSPFEKYASAVGRTPTVESRLAVYRGLMSRLLDGERAVFRVARRYLEFGLDHRHEVEEAQGMVRWQEEDLPRVKALLAEFDSRQKDLDVAISELQRHSRSALEGLRS